MPVVSARDGVHPSDGAAVAAEDLAQGRKGLSMRVLGPVGAPGSGETTS